MLKLVLPLAALLLALPAAAQGNLLDQGRGLLQPRQGSPMAGAGQVAAGLKEALRVGSERVVGTLGRPDGFLKNQDVRIPLPGPLATAQKALAAAGMGSLGDDLVLRMNRAAEAAVPQAKSLFWKAIEEMSVQDAQGILNGPKDAATQYFRRQMSSPLAERMTPVVQKELAAAGAVQSFDKMMGQYKSLPFMPDAGTDLTGYAVQKTLDGIFLYLGREEALIRTNPAARTTDLLKKVFGG